MRHIIFVGSHLGYAMDKTPLGGGAMVGLQLIRHWQREGSRELVVLGSGPQPPRADVEYAALVRPSQGGGRGLVGLSELGYARFCRRFEQETTRWVLDARARFDPSRSCLVVNDISEGPALASLAAAGYPIISLWHVDVVDYFNKLYLRGVVLPERLTRLYERSRRLGGAWVIPDILRLVFEKQRETIAHSARIIVPSKAMADTLRRCYGGLHPERGELDRRLMIVPWGVWEEPVDEAAVRRGVEELRERHRIGPETRVLMTLSRISPEKGLHLLLEALRLLEREGGLEGRDVLLFVCGEPAFMRGTSYLRVVRRAASRLARVRVHFPGYLCAQEKRKYFSLAQLFVSPSVHESYGLNVVEAMQAGLAILASDHYGVRDVLKEDFGLRVHYPSQAKAPPLLAAALKDLLADPGRLLDMGRAARREAQSMPFSAAARRVWDAALELARGEKKAGVSS